MVKPDLDFLINKHKLYQQLWRPAHEHFAEIDTYIDRTFPVWRSPENMDKPFVHPPGAGAIISDALDNLNVLDFQVHRSPTSRRRNAEKRKEEADQLENALKEIMDVAFMEEIVFGLKQMMWHLAAYGYTIMDGPHWTENDRPIEPEREDFSDDKQYDKAYRIWQAESKTWMPIRIHTPHPSRILLPPFESRPSEGFKVEKQYAMQVLEMLDQREDDGLSVLSRPKTPIDPFEEWDVITYWSKEWTSMVVGQEQLYVDENVWRMMPFKHAFSVWGHEPTQATKQGPRSLARGILEDVLDMLLMQAQEMSARHNAYVNEGFGVEYTTGNAEDIIEQLERGSKIIELPQGVEPPRRRDAPRVESWMIQSEQMTEHEIEKGTFSRRASGMREPGERTVGQAAIAQTQVSKQFKAAMKIGERLLSMVGQDILRLVDANDETIYARGHELSPNLINHDYSVWGDFPQRDPAFDLSERSQMLQEHSLGLLDNEGFWMATGKEDVQRIKDGLALDSLRKTPIFQEFLMRKSAERSGINPQEIFPTEQQPMPGAPGQEGMTPPGMQGGPPEGLLGPNGMPIDNMTGQPGTNQQRQALTNEVMNPPRIVP